MVQKLGDSVDVVATGRQQVRRRCRTPSDDEQITFSPEAITAASLDMRLPWRYSSANQGGEMSLILPCIWISTAVTTAGAGFRIDERVAALLYSQHDHDDTPAPRA